MAVVDFSLSTYLPDRYLDDKLLFHTLLWVVHAGNLGRPKSAKNAYRTQMEVCKTFTLKLNIKRPPR